MFQAALSSNSLKIIVTIEHRKEVLCNVSHDTFYVAL